GSSFSARSPTIFSAAMENRCSSFILSRFSGCILKLILRTMLTTSSGTVVGGVGCLNTISIRRNTTHYRESGRQIFRMARVFQQDLLQYSQLLEDLLQYSQLLEDLLQYSQ